MEESFFVGLQIVEIMDIKKTYTDLKEFSLEHPRKLRTFAFEISTVGVSAAFFSMSVSSQKLSTAPWHRDEECLSISSCKC